MVYCTKNKTETAQTQNTSQQQNSTKPDHINQENWENLTQTRGLDPAWTSANCKSIGSEEASEFLYQQAKSDGLLIGSENSPQQQFKPDKPWSGEKGKKAPKYRTPVDDNYDAILPADPNNPNYWIDIEKLKERAYKIDGIPCLIITEGGLKAIPGCSNGYPTIGLCGVEMGLTSGKKDPQGKRYLIATLERFAKHGFGFIFAFDADCARKKEVINAERKLADALEKVSGVPVYSITGTWEEPAGKGMDDYIQNHGIEEFRKRLQEAELVREKYGTDNGDEETKNDGPPRAGEIGKELAEKYRDRWVYCSDVGWMVYSKDREGVWTRVNPDYIEHGIQIELEAKELDSFVTNSYINNIAGYLKRKLFIDAWDEQDNRFLPFQNGVLELATNKLHEHSPGFRLTWKLPRDYNPVDADFPVFHKFLSRLVSSDLEYRIIICFMAAVLRGRYDLEKFLYIIGQGQDGKSKLMELIIALIGQENHTTFSLESLEDKHNIINLFGKRLLTIPDQDPISTRSMGNFKRLTGGDYLTGRLMRENPTSFKFRGLAMMTSNRPYVFPGSAKKWLNRREILIECKKPIAKEERDNRLLDKMIEELPAITTYLLSIPEQEIEDTLLGNDQPDLTSTSWEFKCESDGLAAWINDQLIYDAEAATLIGSDGNTWKKDTYNPEFSTLYASYCHYCRETGRSPKTTQIFSADLLQITQGLLGWQVTKKRRNQGWSLVGVRLRTDRDNNKPTVDETLTHDNHDNPMTTETATGWNGSNSDIEGDLGNHDNHDNQNRYPTKSNLETSTSKASQHEINKEARLEVENKKNAKNAGMVGMVNSDSGTEGNQAMTTGCHGKDSGWNGCHGEIDYSTFPATRSDDYRHKEKEAYKIREQFLGIRSKEDMKQFKASHDGKQKQANWVWHNLLTQAERDQINHAKTVEQSSLF